MLHWLKELRVQSSGNCTNCQEFESRITFLEQQLEEYRKRLEGAEKLQGFISDMLENAEHEVGKLFKEIGDVRDSAQRIWTSAAALNTRIARIIKEAQRASPQQSAQN